MGKREKNEFKGLKGWIRTRVGHMKR